MIQQYIKLYNIYDKTQLPNVRSKSTVPIETNRPNKLNFYPSKSKSTSTWYSANKRRNKSQEFIRVKPNLKQKSTSKCCFTIILEERLKSHNSKRASIDKENSTQTKQDNVNANEKIK